MKDLILNFSIGIVSGTFAGVLSSLLVYLYSEKRNKARKIIEYAELTTEKSLQVLDECDSICSGGKSIETLKLLLKREIRRSFPGAIVDKSVLSQRLQDAITACNRAMYLIEESLSKEDIPDHLLHASNKLNDAIIDIWNATTEFDVNEDKKIIKFKKRIFIYIPIIILISIVGIIYSAF